MPSGSGLASRLEQSSRTRSIRLEFECLADENLRFRRILAMCTGIFTRKCAYSNKSNSGCERVSAH